MSFNWQRLHRFLAGQSFYPICLASGLATAIFILRVLFSRSLVHGVLVWNLFLAWLPYGFSLLAAGLHRRYPGRWGLLILPGLAWLAFFPNAPYLVTDLYHLGYLPPVPMWFDIGLISIYAFTGFFLATASLRSMQNLARAYFGGRVSWAFALIAICLGGLGIYLGRFVRVNSWDLLVHPLRIARNLAAPVLYPRENLRFFGFTLMFTAILLVFYLMFQSANQREE
jgi:uncharacterized membrane protein